MLSSQMLWPRSWSNFVAFMMSPLLRGPRAKWVDRLREADQSWWQALPVGPTGYGNSPYQSLSSFAGNGLLISPQLLVEDGLLRPGDCEGPPFPATAVDYG